MRFYAAMLLIMLLTVITLGLTGMYYVNQHRSSHCTVTGSSTAWTPFPEAQTTEVNCTP